MKESKTRITGEIKMYVTFYYPGTFFAEDETIEVESFDPIALDIPEGVYAFQFYNIETLKTTVHGIDFEKHNGPFGKSKMYYPDGKVLTLAELEAEFGRDSILYHNVKGNGYQFAVKTRRGNYQFFNPETDEILPKHED